MIISLKFFGVLLGSALIYWAIPRQKYRNLFLSLISLAFITWFDKWAGVLIVTLTVFSYFFAVLIYSNKNKKLFHRIGIIGLLGVLIAFKYTDLLAETFNQFSTFINALPKFHIEKLLLPL